MAVAVTSTKANVVGDKLVLEGKTRSRMAEIQKFGSLKDFLRFAVGILALERNMGTNKNCHIPNVVLDDIAYQAIFYRLFRLVSNTWLWLPLNLLDPIWTLVHT